jgi:hypothetical protein
MKYILLDDIIVEELSHKYALRIELSDSCGYYFILPNKDETITLTYLTNFIALTDYLARIYNIATKSVTHGSRTYTVFI